MSECNTIIQKLLNIESFNIVRERVLAVSHNIKNHGILLQDKRRCITGYSYGEFYDWDLYFENILMSYFGVSVYCRNGVEMFLDKQLNNGFVARTIISPRHRQHFKPFLAQTALLGSRQSGDFRWLRGKYYYGLKKYLDYWFWFCDFDKNGLPVWDSADHSGMDNQDRRAGVMGQMTVEGVDLNCYLVRELKAMAEICKEINKPEDGQEFLNHAQRLTGLINSFLWDDTDGFYYDRDERKGELIKVKSVAGLTPLWAGIASEAQAKRLVEEHIVNPKEFWTKYPIATWSKTEPDYYQEAIGRECNWRGTTWIPTNYMVFHGLLDYGYNDIAKDLAEKTLEMLLLESTTREFYNSENGNGMGLNPFWGWSALGYFMLLEFELKYNPTDLELKRFSKLSNDYLGVTF